MNDDREYPIGYDDPTLAAEMRTRAAESAFDAEIYSILATAPRLRRLRLARALGRRTGYLLCLLGYVALLLIVAAAATAFIHLVWRYIAWAWGAS